uniref:Uncharacterized protein n=1 Tax=Manihot esculenta TaxID=3983 RepID=A0A2C9WES6_MANES
MKSTLPFVTVTWTLMTPFRDSFLKMKETQESRAWGSNNGYHGVKADAEYNVDHASSQISYNDDVGKVESMRGNLSVASSITSSSPLTYHVKTTKEPPSLYRSFNVDNGRQTFGTGGSILSSEQTSGRSLAALDSGPRGHVSMADIVKMGRPHVQGSSVAAETSNTLEDMDARDSLDSFLKPSHDSSPSPAPLELHQDLQCSHPANLSKSAYQSGTTTTSQHNFDDKWPVIEQQESGRESCSRSSFANGSVLLNGKVSSTAANLKQLSLEKESKLVLLPEDDHPLVFPNDMRASAADCQHLSFGTFNSGLQQLSLEKESKLVLLPEDDHPVVFPNDMRASAADCPHLSFGTFNSGVHAKISGPLASKPSKSNLKEVPAVIDGSSSVCLDTRNSGYFGESLCSKQPELTRENIHEFNNGHDFTSEKSVPDSCFKNIQEPTTPWPVMISPHASDIPPLHCELILNSGAFSLPDSYSSTMPGVGFGAGLVLPRHLVAHSYPRSSSGYSAVCQTYPCTPSALQQAYQHSSVFRDPRARMKYNLQPSKEVLPRSSLPLSSANICSYEGLGNPINLSGRFLNDLSTIPNVVLGNPANFSERSLNDLPTTLGGYAVDYNDFLRGQCEEENNFTMLQQDYGRGSRTSSTVTENGYYCLQRQSQLRSTHQDQQRSQNYGALGCINVYHSQQTISQDEQLKSLGDSAFRSSQGPSEQFQPFWRHIW